MGRIILALVFGTLFGVLGTGVGGAIGYLGGLFVSTHQNSAIEACATIDAAANQKLITSAQAEKIGAVMVKEAMKTQDAEVIKMWLEFDTPNAGEACKQFRKGIDRA
jgi:signal recognition particle GTPase